MPYDPPTERDYSYLEPYLEAYDLGHKAYTAGVKEGKNPYKSSGHERDTTMEDDERYEWWRCWWHACEDDTSKS